MRDGDARGPQTGSVSTRRPSISISTVEWPSQVARSPLAGGLPQASSGFIDGSGPRGVRLAQTRDDRVHVSEPLARPARRSLDALEPRTLRVAAERLHVRLV